MKKISFLLLVSLILGCTSASEQIRIKNRENLLRLSIGMGKFEVLQIMGTQTVESINNPYKVETPKGEDGALYEVLFYHTELKNKDGLISDDELTPIVFKDDKLIGWGWAFLNEIVPNYQNQPKFP
jgi:hypothetical protein